MSMQSINYFKRIGIEAEIHTYLIKEAIKNKTVLAASTAKIPAEQSIDCLYLELVSEGGDTGFRYFELVFGPVKDIEMKGVKRVLNIAKGIASAKVKSVASWVKAFNLKLSAESLGGNYTLELKKDCSIDWTRSGGVSIQANILTPVSYFSDKNKVTDFFLGIPDALFDYSSACDKLANFPQDAWRLKAAVFMAAYFCGIYTYNGIQFGNEIIKQKFPILPRI